MNKPASSFHTFRAPLLGAIALALAQLPRASAALPTDETLRRGEVKQQQIQTESQKIVAQLDAMIGEYQRNGIIGDELGTLKKLRGVLEKLSQKEMKQIVELLQQARTAPDAQSSLKSVTGAYTGQKAMLVQMKRLLAEYQRQQGALEISNAVLQLAERQGVNLQNGIEVG